MKHHETGQCEENFRTDDTWQETFLSSTLTSHAECLGIGLTAYQQTAAKQIDEMCFILYVENFLSSWRFNPTDVKKYPKQKLFGQCDCPADR